MNESIHRTTEDVARMWAALQERATNYPGQNHGKDDVSEWAVGEINRLRDALKEIAEGRGPFSTDQLTFATSVIESMKQKANEALSALMEA